MAEFNLNNTTTVGLTAVPDFIVENMALEIANSDGSETFVYFDKAPENFGYQYNHPQVASPLNSICTWAYGQGWTSENKQTTRQLQNMDGNGKETFNEIIWNHGNVKLGHGDAFAEIMRTPDGNLLNLMNKSPERVKVVFEGPRITRYEIWDGSDWIKKDTNQIFHTMNKKLGDSVRGTGQIQSNKNVNDAMIEAFEDERIIKHRDKALGIVYYKTNDEGKIAYANKKITEAVTRGDMVGMPEGTAKIEPYPSKSSEDRQNWLQYVEGLSYQTGNTPKSIVTSDGTSEVGGINGHLIFEPIYGKEQLDMENSLWAQVAIKIKFTRPPSLAPKTQENAEKNTGQTAIQPGEVEPKLNR